MAQIINYIHVKQWGVITHPCSNLNDGLVKHIAVRHVIHFIENYGCHMLVHRAPGKRDYIHILDCNVFLPGTISMMTVM